MSFIPDIRLFSCHYTSQQSCADEGRELNQLNFPENVKMTRVVCTGKLEEITLLKAFEDGADGVYVVGCPAEGCHNVRGSQRAAKRVEAVRSALSELGVEEERAKMFFLPRGLHPEFVDVAQEMNDQVTELGPSPF
ncbi:MAG: hydrogenase iron-sulfur subunit [Candidatus Electrothrix sp. GW3-4]|uniref:hydrogenase iron-sulfur subunit n=1 Tax=Candidatus Electrothrix sp. GW3-4 TaxID=3126740 RepID=UPI0030D045BF